MSLKDVPEGSYRANLVDWDVIEVEHLDGKLQLALRFYFEDDKKNHQNIWWKGFFQKKNGEISQKTKNTMLVCGFKYNKLSEIERVDAFDTTKDLEITLTRNEKNYLEVEWVNEAGGAQALEGALGKEGGAKKLKGLDSIFAGEVVKERQEKKSKKSVKNEAPGAKQNSEAPTFDQDEFLSF